MVGSVRLFLKYALSNPLPIRESNLMKVLESVEVGWMPYLVMSKFDEHVDFTFVKF